MSTYEAIFIFPETIKEDGLDAVIKTAAAEIEKVGGKVENTTRMGRKSFARVMQKQEAGHYVLMLVDIDGDKLSSLHARYRLMDDVFRVQFVKAEPVTEKAQKEVEDGVAE